MDDLIENNPSQACIDVINTYMNGRKPVGNKNMTAEDVADQIRQLNHGSGEAFELDFQHAAQLIRDFAVQETAGLRAGVCYAIETLETHLAETQQQLAAVRMDVTAQAEALGQEKAEVARLRAENAVIYMLLQATREYVNSYTGSNVTADLATTSKQLLRKIDNALAPRDASAETKEMRS